MYTRDVTICIWERSWTDIGKNFFENDEGDDLYMDGMLVGEFYNDCMELGGKLRN